MSSQTGDNRSEQQDQPVMPVWLPQPGPQVLACMCPADIIFFGGSRGGGKMLANSSKILTPKGWITHGDARVGMVIADPETGGTQRIVGVYPQGDLDLYRVTFDDGSSVLAGLEHLWAYKCPNRRRPRTKKSKQRDAVARVFGHDYSASGRYASFQVDTTEKMMGEFEKGFAPRIPLTAPVLFSVNGRSGKSVLDPYLVGLMLGDGSFGSGKCSNRMTTGDAEIAEFLESQGFKPGDKEPASDGIFRSWYIPKTTPVGLALSRWVVNHKLYGTHSWDKFIPKYVFTADFEYRLGLLQGLLDSDGSVDERGHVEFVSVSNALALGVRDLVRSFGGKATVSKPIQGQYRDKDGQVVNCRQYRRVYIWSDHASKMFRLSRKKKRCVDSWNGGYENMRKVVSIEYSHRALATCIKVSSPHGLYVTDDYIVTHNSDCAIGRQINGALKWGYAWNGLFLRKNYKHFAELRRRIKELIRAGLPAELKGGDGQTNRLVFENGALVLLTAIEHEKQLEFFQGQQIPEISIEEACQFSFINSMIEKLKGCMRSPHGVPCKMFLTGNPGGPGHNQIKARFISPAPGGGVPLKGEDGDISIFIPSSVEDNKILQTNDPRYVSRLRSIKDPKLRRAWLFGDWDVVAGGFFDDVWDHMTHVIPKFRVPDHWPRVMGIDWGTAYPFAVGWYAVASGEYVPELQRTLPKGALVLYDEWYGCVKDQPNVGIRLNSEQVARGIIAREEKRGEGHLFFDRVADPKMFAQDDGPSIAENMAEAGVVLRKADNKRIPGWDKMRWYMSMHEIPPDTREGEPAPEKPEGGWPRKPMFYVADRCVHFIRTVPILERDEKEWDDVSDDQEDHHADSCRYVMMSRQSPGKRADEPKEHIKTACERDFEEIEADYIELEEDGAWGDIAPVF